MDGFGAIPTVITTYAQACVQCGKGKKDAPLQRCGGCHRVCYCGSECQTAHWPKHKAICKALKTLETKHAEELRRPFQAVDEFSGEPVGNADLANACISRVSKVEKRVLTERLGRRPVFDEESLMDWQPRCLACGRSNLILRVEASSESKVALPTLKECPDCHLSFACNDTHWNAVESSHKTLPCRDSVYGKSQCQMNRAVLQDLLFSQAMVKVQAQIGPFRWAPKRTMSKWTSLTGVDWSDYESELKNEFGDRVAADSMLKPMLRAVTEGMSMPLTMLWALEILNGEDLSWTKKDVLNIHVLNATAKEAFYADIFEEILHRLPEVKTLNLNFIGPELTVVAGSKLVTAPMKSCPDCSRTGRKRVHQYHAKSYDAYLRTQGAGYTSPDLAVAFNSDSSQRALPVWKDTLKALMDRHVPTVFTAFTHNDAQAESRLLQATGATLVPELGPRLNPWGSVLVKMTPNTINGFYASSGWLSGGFR
ncbi:hypothetical protein D9619_009281 [Psilocybe cf. subviscida]|uniref:MYND-type domain-containing protein n=1 Tax=Psilocybe cf. subviscida TaxID=2480587 RepID=A0A8H5BUX3_9AGAR|nr:hypothetical protein D9619_009281 [Psilocybe cf. subviscida]